MLHLVHRVGRFALIIVFLGTFISSVAVQAAFATVNTCTEAALRAAIAGAGAGGTVRFGVDCTGASAITLTTSTPLALTSDLTIDNNGHAVVLDGNHATRVFTVAVGATVQLSGLTIQDGQSPTGQNGGGIFNSGTLTLTNCVVRNNRAQADGIGINSIGGFGGGIAGDGDQFESISSTTLINTTVDSNTSTGTRAFTEIGGGGIHSTGTVVLRGSAVTNNQATGSGGGGGISVDAFPGAGNLTLTNSTVSGNSTAFGGWGAGIFNSNATVTLVSSTVAGNHTGGGAFTGGIYNLGGTVSLTDTIVAGNTDSVPSSQPEPDVSFSSFASGGHNLIGSDTSDCSGSCFTAAGDVKNVNPLLGSLGTYTGPTQTVPLLPGSPAIDGGACPSGVTADQRGITRPQGSACDIGAFESQGFTLAATGGTPQSALVNTAFAVPLQVGVTSTHNEPVNGGKITFTAPATGASATLTGSPATIAGGTASVSATANATAGGPYTVTASASGVATPTAFSLTNTQAANQPPVTTVPTAQTILEDHTLTFGSGTGNAIAVSDPDANGNTEAVTLSVGHGTLTLGTTANVSITAGSNGGAAVTITGTLAALNAALNGLVYAPASDYNGADTLTVSTDDQGNTGTGGPQTATSTVGITITPVNDPPSFTAGSNQSVSENAGAQSVTHWATNIAAGPANEAGQTLTFVITNDTNPALFAALPAVAADGTLTYTPAANTVGTATLTLVLKDSGGSANGGNDTSAAQTFTISVLALPTITPHIAGTLGSNGWYTSDVTVTWTVTNSTSTTGCDPTTIKTDTPGTTLTCTATGPGGTASVSVTIKRDTTAPKVTATANPSSVWPPNHKFVPVTVTVSVGDTGSQPTGFTLVAATASGEPGDIKGFVVGQASVSGEVRANKDEVYTLTYKATDQAGNSTTVTVTIAVPHDQGQGNGDAGAASPSLPSSRPSPGTTGSAATGDANPLPQPRP